ncbi:MAG TPA: winged helix-turn-helix domain-containing protein, partial [Caulobacteraceae bacterium]|nr:winged helix-turn-helix domain-containing protein [Caulobacteraceae bacterium]
MSRSLSAGQARRIALAAQGLADPRPTRPVNRRAFRALTRRLGVLQLDSVNVMVRTHYMPAFSRLGPYPPALLEDEAWGRRPS